MRTLGRSRRADCDRRDRRGVHALSSLAPPMAVEEQQQFGRHGERATVDSATASPSVLAVVVTHNPAPEFESTLRSLAAQDYPRLSVLVVDAGSDDDLTAQVKSILPAATIVREADSGFGAAANVVIDGGMRAALYMFCHDDIALRADAVSRLVEEVLRSNAAVVGPKLVEWDDATPTEGRRVARRQVRRVDLGRRARRARPGAARRVDRRVRRARRVHDDPGRPLPHHRRLRRRHHVPR